MQSVKIATVGGWSMEPILKEGDIILYRSTNYSLGDIILFKYGTLNLTHRLIKIENLLLTKGDNIPSWDAHIEKKDVLGVAEYVIRKNRIICLTNQTINKRFLNYAKLEMKSITLIENLLNIKSYKVNGFIKRVMMPLLIWNYILLLIYNRKSSIPNILNELENNVGK
ncbi:MAG TPA: S24/S26 family peptidase [Bacteroidia bacterium]|nr:S24/S26 family peptidase [Bacteroidia bacterium]